MFRSVTTKRYDRSVFVVHAAGEPDVGSTMPAADVDGKVSSAPLQTTPLPWPM